MERRYLPALRGQFGSWIFYSCLMPAAEAVHRVSFAENLFRSERLSEYVQRRLKQGRAKDIAAYILRDEERFFNSLVVGVVGGDPSWHEVAEVTGKIDIELPKPSAHTLGYLSFDGSEQMFALDGQHRLFGLAEALRQDDGTIRNDVVSLVFVAHKNTKDGMRRSRHLFSTLNKNAKPIGKGERIATDEADVMAIVTRAFIEERIHFRDEEIRFTQTDSLPSSDRSHFTTIGNLYEIFSTIFPLMKGEDISDLKSIRPPESIIDEYKQFGSVFFELGRKYFLPLDQYFRSKNGSAVIEKYRNENGGHLLFRPIGLRVLAETVSHVMKSEKLSINNAFEKIGNMPTDLTREPYADVLWLPNQKKMNPGGRVLARNIVLHMVGATKIPSDLLNKYAKQKGVPIDSIDLPKKLG